jgi:hypothetical protein
LNCLADNRELAAEAAPADGAAAAGDAARTAAAPADDTTVLLLRDIAFEDVAALLGGYGLRLQRIGDDAPIPGSYWGEPEAGLVGDTVFARSDTPVHSLLHEASHLIVLDPARRQVVHTDATDSVEEEDAVCVLQSLLGDALPGVGAARVLADMDAWGYTFRLGSARAYVEADADAAWAWLAQRGLVDAQRRLQVPPEPRLAPSSRRA